MTSPVDTSVKFFTSAMLGAPILRGQAGSIIALLDACLVNGWGVQAASSCVVAGGVCTMTFPLDHAALVDSVIFVAGASLADLNGEQKVTVVEPNVLKFATALADGTATGTITAKMAPGGWEKKFTGTNLAVYKSLSVQANGHFLRVNDAGTTAARAVGYETMTAVSTGTLLFPTAAQVSGGHFWQKSGVAGTVPIDWLIACDGRTFYLMPSWFIGNGDGYQNYKSAPLYTFGDPVNLGKSADPFNTTIFGGNTLDDGFAAKLALMTGNTQFRYCPRISNGTGTAQQVNAHPMSSEQARDECFDRHTGQVSLSEVVLRVGVTNSWRAKMPGVCIGEQISMELLLPPVSVIGLGNPEKSYLATLTGTSMGQLSQLYLLAFDITGPWR